MTEKTEEQIEKERAAVAAMKNAQANMTTALKRIETLESALRSASGSLSVAKGYIGENTYIYSERTSCRSRIDSAIEAIAKALG